MSAKQILRYQLFIWHLAGIRTSPTIINRVCAIFNHAIFNISFISCALLNLLFAEDLSEVVDTLLPCLTAIIFSIKSFYVFLNNKNIEKLLELLDELENTFKLNENERKIIDDILRECRIGTYMICTLTPGGILWYFVQTLFKEGRVLLWPSWAPFDVKHNAVKYWIFLMYQLTASFYLGIQSTASDSYGPTLNNLLSGYIKVLGLKLENLGMDKNFKHKAKHLSLIQSSKMDTDYKKLQEIKLKSYVKYHELCMRYSKLLDSVLSPQYLTQFATSGVIICFLMFTLSSLNPVEKTTEFFMNFEYFMTMVVEIFVPCFVCSRITAQSNLLPISMYTSNWIDQTKSFKSTMLIFIERSLKPLTPMAGGLILVGLPTFVSMMRVAYSLLTFLKSFD